MFKNAYFQRNKFRTKDAPESLFISDTRATLNLIVYFS